MLLNHNNKIKYPEQITQLKNLKVLMLPDCQTVNPYQSLLANALREYDVEVSFLKEYRRIFPLLRTVINYPTRLNIIHLHWLNSYLKGRNRYTKTIYGFKFLLEIWLLKLLGINLVWTIHNRLTHDSQFPQLELWFRRQLARLVDGIILHNQATMNDLAKEYNFDSEKVSVIPHGHYREVYQPAIDYQTARQKLNLPQTGNIYLHLGLLRPYKGVENLLQIWQENRSILQQDTLVIAGKADEKYKYNLERLSGTSKNIIFIPQFIENEKIHLFFSAATVIVLPYIALLNSGSLLLAMSYGKPIIAPRLGSIPEVLGMANTLLYDPQKETGLLEALKLSTQIDLEKLSWQVTQACDRLDWSSIAEKTAQKYERISVNSR